MNKQCLTKPIWKSAIGANPKAKRLKLKADNNGLFSCPVYFLSTEDIIVNEDAENIFVRNMVGSTTLKRSQKWIKIFHHLTLGTVHISYLKEAKHQTYQCF